MVLHLYFRNKQSWLQSWSACWAYINLYFRNKLFAKLICSLGLLQPLFQDQVDCKVDLLTGPTSTSVSGTSWLQSWSAHWAYFNLCFRNKLIAKLICSLGLLQPLFQEQVDCKVDLLTGPTSTSVSGTSWLQSWSAHWAYFNLCFRNKLIAKLICSLGLLQPLFQEQVDCKVDLLTGPTSTSVSGTKLICTLGLLYIQNIQERWDSSAGRPSDQKARCNTDVQVRVPGVARDFSPRVSFQCRLSHGVCTAPVCNRMHQHLCAR